MAATSWPTPSPRRRAEPQCEDAFPASSIGLSVPSAEIPPVSSATARPLLASGVREVLGIHRTVNHETIAATRSKGIPRLGTITRYRVLWKVWFDYVDAELAISTARQYEPEIEDELSEPGL